MEEKEQAYQELRTDYSKVSRERNALQNRLLEMSTQVAETSITKEFQTFKEEFLFLLRTFQQPGPSATPPALSATTSQQEATQVKKKAATQAKAYKDA